MKSNKDINWGPACFIFIYQIALFFFLPIYFYFTLPSLGASITAAILLYATGLSITAGYHRFYSHRTYKTNVVVEFILLFLGSMAAQGSALRWSFDHRIHHAHVDTDNDPYSIKKGFWYAHFLWILEVPRKIDPKVVPDLLKNRMVMFQHNHYRATLVGTNALVVLFTGWLFNDYWGAFFITCWTRMFFLHHFTWFINSLAHVWGDKPFCQELSAVDNYFLSMLTFGEGYHNYHHTFANDYRNGIRWYHFDPTKWLIWSLNQLGLAHSLKKVDEATIRKRMVTESKYAVLEKVKDLCSSNAKELEMMVHDLSDCLIAKLSELAALKEQYLNYDPSMLELESIASMNSQLKQLKKDLRADWRRWKHLCNDIMDGKPVFA
jgi:stearoyl-CoA desaturase (delta-9 desaturase)